MYRHLSRDIARNTLNLEYRLRGRGIVVRCAAFISRVFV
jgi:hypothetical protein